MAIELKRIYDDVSSDDGCRILVDRIWPRGLSKEDAKLDEWLKSVAPSDDLREWFHSEHSEWDEFRKRYLAELKEHREDLRPFADKAKQQRVTLLYSSKDKEQNNAVVLKEYLGRLGGDG